MVFAAIVAPGIAGAVPGISSFLVLPFVDEFHVTRGETLLYFGLGAIFAGALGPVAGRLLVTRAPWTLMLFGAIAISAGLYGASLAPSLLLAVLGFLVAHTLGGVFCSGLAGQTIIVRTFPERLGIVAGVQIVAIGLAGVAISLVLAPVLAAHGWRFALAAVALTLLAVLPGLILLFLRGKAPPPTTTPEAAHGDGASNAIAPTSLQILSAPAFWLVLLALEPATLVAGALGGNLIPYYDDRGVDLQNASYAMATISGASALGALSIGFLADRVIPALMLAGIAAVAFVCMCGLTFDVGVPVVWLGLTFFAMSGLGPALSATMRHYFGAAGYAPSVGMLGPFMIVSAFAGAIAGWMRDLLGDYQLVFAILAAGMLVSLVASLLLLKARPCVYLKASEH
jgi:cyanate permease